jgi:outer membrane protein assembly factor BamB
MYSRPRDLIPMRFILLGTMLAVAASAGAADWPGWRGPTGQGVCAEKDLPLRWDAKSGLNILWKTPLPGADGKLRQDQNQSSPIVKKGLVFITTSYWPAGRSEKQYPEHHVVCYRGRDGKQLWDTTVDPGPWLLSDLRGGYTVPTPAADDERVYVVFGSSVIAALSHSGKQIWRKEIVPHDFDVTMAGSPVLYRGTVLLQCDGVRNSRMIGFEVKTGDVRWTEKRTTGFSHSTPVLVRIKDRPQLLVAAASAVQGVDPEDGKLLWWCQGAGDTVSPVMAGGLVYCDGGRGGMGVAVDPTGTGDVTKTHRKWKLDRVPGGFSSPVTVGDHLYRLTDPGIIRSWKLATGEEEAALRLPGVSTAASPFTTPEGRIYAISSGKSFVLNAGVKPEILAVSELGDGSPASPAVAEGRIILKGRRFVWCIGKKE